MFLIDKIKKKAPDSCLIGFRRVWIVKNRPVSVDNILKLRFKLCFLPLPIGIQR